MPPPPPLPAPRFAKGSKDNRKEWLSFTKEYFIGREKLLHVLLLIDSSVPPQAIDLECAAWLAECEVPFAVVFTKVWKEKQNYCDCASTPPTTSGWTYPPTLLPHCAYCIAAVGLHAALGLFLSQATSDARAPKRFPTRPLALVLTLNPALLRLSPGAQMDLRKSGGATNAANVVAFKSALAADWDALPLCFETSSASGGGRAEVLAYLGSLREMSL